MGTLTVRLFKATVVLELNAVFIRPLVAAINNINVSSSHQ